MSVTFDYHTLLYSSEAILLGYQSLLFFTFAKLIACQNRFASSADKVLGVAGTQSARAAYDNRSFSRPDWHRAGHPGCPAMGIGRIWSTAPATTIRLVIFSVLFSLLGGQTVLASFYFGLVNLVAERRASRRTSVPEAAANGADAT